MIKNRWFCPIEENISGKIKAVLQGNEAGASKESLRRLELFNKQFNLIEARMKRINSRLLINKSYKPATVIIGKLKDPDRRWTDGAIEYLSEDDFIFRVFMYFDEHENKFDFSSNHQFDIYKDREVCHDNAILMYIEHQEGGIVYVGGVDIGIYSSDKSIQDINEGDKEKYLAVFDKMEKNLLKITADAEEYFEELFNDNTEKIIDIIEVAVCEFADASLKRQQGLCIEYTISSDDIFQSAYTSYQLRVLENGKIDGVGIHI